MQTIIAVAFLGAVCAWAEVERFQTFPSTVALAHNTTSHITNNTKKAEPPTESIRDGHGVLALNLTSSSLMSESPEKVVSSAKETTYTTVDQPKTTKHQSANVYPVYHSHVTNNNRKAELPSESIRYGDGVLALNSIVASLMPESTEKSVRSVKAATYTTGDQPKTTKHHSTNVYPIYHSLPTVKIHDASTNLPTTTNAEISTLVNPTQIYNPSTFIRTVENDYLPPTFQSVQIDKSPTTIESVNKAEQPLVSVTTVDTPAEHSVTTETVNLSTLKQINNSNAANQKANDAKHSSTVVIRTSCAPTSHLPTFDNITYTTLVQILRSAIAGQTSYNTIAAILANTADKQNSKVPMNHVKLLMSPSRVLSPLKLSNTPVKKVEALANLLAVEAPPIFNTNVSPVFTKSSFTEMPSEVIAVDVENSQEPKRNSGIVDSRPTFVNFESRNRGVANPFSFDVPKPSGSVAGGKVPAANPFFFNSAEPLDSLERVKLSGSPVNELDAEMSPVLVISNPASEGGPLMAPDLIKGTVTQKPTASRPKKSDYVLDTPVCSGYEQKLLAPQSVNVVEPWDNQLFHWWDPTRRSIKKSKYTFNPTNSYDNVSNPESRTIKDLAFLHFGGPSPIEKYKEKSHGFFRLWPLTNYQKKIPGSPLDHMPPFSPIRPCGARLKNAY